MVMGYWSVAILFWPLSIDHIVNVLKSYIKDVVLPGHAWDTPPFLLLVSPTLPVQSVDAYVRMYVRTLGQSRDNQTKRGWPYSMSMGLCPTRASRAREPRYNKSSIQSSSTPSLISPPPLHCPLLFLTMKCINGALHFITVTLHADWTQGAKKVGLAPGYWTHLSWN